MLILARKSQEKVRLTYPGLPPIWVTVCNVEQCRRGDWKVRLGFEAVEECEILREELCEPSPAERG